MLTLGTLASLLAVPGRIQQDLREREAKLNPSKGISSMRARNKAEEQRLGM